MSPFQRHALLLLGLTFALYARTLFYPFVDFDDPGIVLENPVLRESSLDAWVSAATERQGGTFLPVRALSYKIDFALGGGRPFVFHLHNLLLAGVLHVLAYAALRGLLRDPRAALVGAILYAVHPVHVESIAWVTGRKDLLSSALALAALLCYRRARSRDPASLAPSALGLFALAVLSKGTAIVLPLWLVLEEFLEPRKGAAPSLARRSFGPAFLFLAALLLFVVHYQEARLAGVEKEAGDAGERLRTVAGGFLEHVRLLLLPDPLTARCRSAFRSPLLLLALPAIAAAVLWLWPRRNASGPFPRLGIAWFVIFLLPTSNLIRTSTPAADRYLILASLALAIALGPALARRLACAGAAAAALALLTLLRQPVWSASPRLWKDTLRKTEVSLQTFARIKAARSVSEGEAPAIPARPDAAHRLVLPASRASDPAWQVWEHMGLVLLDLRKPGDSQETLARKTREAVEAFDRAIRRSPGNAGLYLSRALARIGLPVASESERDLARKDFRRCVYLDPDDARAWYYYGLFLLQSGDEAGAERALTEIERIDSRGHGGTSPGTRPSPVYAGGAYYLRSRCRAARGDRAGEAGDLDRAIGLVPGYAAARACRALIRKEEGRFRDALQDLDVFFKGESSPASDFLPVSARMAFEARYLAATCHALLAEDAEAGRLLESLGTAARERIRDDPDWAGFRARRARP